MLKSKNYGGVYSCLLKTHMKAPLNFWGSTSDSYEEKVLASYTFSFEENEMIGTFDFVM